MTITEMSKKSNLLRGTIKYRLKRLGYHPSRETNYMYSTYNEVLKFNVREYPKRKTDYSLEAVIFFYFKDNKNNSTKQISEALNIPENKIISNINRVFKTGFVHVESKMNNQ